ncbi:MAG: hypothetical protein AAFP85_18045 [Pseudomonadota bacterium]
MTKPIVLYAVALTTLSACAADPNPPTVSRSDVDRAYAEAQRIERLPETSLIELPTGTVTYDGQIGANVSGDANGDILADMTMIVGFGSGDVDGTVDNINLIDPDGTPNQRFDGDLDIDGNVRNGEINADAEGEITGVDVDGFVVDSRMELNLDGTVRDDVINGDTVFGDAEGTARGDFDMNIDGVFFGAQR